MRILLAAAVIGVAVPAAAQNAYQPDPLEYAPEGQVECSWSTMKKDEYDECLKKKNFFSKMTGEEKKRYNEDVYDRELEQRVRSLERRVDMLERGRR